MKVFARRLLWRIKNVRCGNPVLVSREMVDFALQESHCRDRRVMVSAVHELTNVKLSTEQRAENRTTQNPHVLPESPVELLCFPQRQKTPPCCLPGHVCLCPPGR